jgi:hypothetical protein
MITLGSRNRVMLLLAWAVLGYYSVSHHAKPADLSRSATARTAAGPQQKRPSRGTDLGPSKSVPLPTDILETTLSFRGWLGETAVLRREELLTDGGMHTSFFLLRPNKPWSRLRTNPRSEAQNDPPGLQEGRVLIADYVRKSERPRISFQLDADPSQIRALQESISDSLEQKPVPAVPATLTISMESPKSGRVTLWKQTRALTTTVGESGMVYRPPDLRSAILSPKGSALLFELIANDKSEYFVVSMRPFHAL